MSPRQTGIPICPNCRRPVNDHNPNTCCIKHGLPLAQPRDGRPACRDCWWDNPTIQPCCGLAAPKHAHACPQKTPRHHQ